MSNEERRAFRQAMRRPTGAQAMPESNPPENFLLRMLQWR
jgi:hypothetical protein